MIDMPYNPTKPNPIYLIYMYKEDLALNNLQGLICWYAMKPNQTKNFKYVDVYFCKLELMNFEISNFLIFAIFLK